MDWSFKPGQSPTSLASDLPSPETIAAYESLLDDVRLNFGRFDKAVSTILWRRLDDEVSRGSLSADEVYTLRRDHDGHYSIPLARRFLEADQAEAVTKWMRELSSFWDFNWIDCNIKGARGRGTIKMFECLRDHGGANQIAMLAADHLWFRLIGARYREGLRHELRSFNTNQSYRDTVSKQLGKFGHSYLDLMFDWMEYLLLHLRPFVEIGTDAPLERYLRVEAEVRKERQRFLEATASDRTQ
ncbi:MAG: hypothetical protein EAY70_08075 [Sphingomonadales bacterium]|nr:MAG: hypothetical protein EAY70_08075 [Sphingomonadales bacterium]